MLPHLFKLIWNKKKQNFLLTAEILVSFMVIFAVFTLLIYAYSNFRKPMNFEYKNVWTANYGIPEGMQNKDSIAMALDGLKKSILSLPQVESLSFYSNNVPFSASTMNWGVSYKNQRVQTDIYDTEPNIPEVLDLKLVNGTWFSRADNSSAKPVVINESLKEKLFGTENPLGKILKDDDNKFKVVGVVADFKSKGDYQPADYGMYQPMDSTTYSHGNAMLIKVSPDADAAFEGKLYKTIANFSRGTSIEIEHLDRKREVKNRITLVPTIILLIISGFLIFNVALGLFGVLWYNISKRKGEIGLRRALGATGQSISGQLVAETLVLSTFALLLGSFFAVQFPLLNVFDLPGHVYYTAIISAIVFIYILASVCALYPGKQAAGILPAVALHEE
ncbi:MAG TPA: ABC transporter permease [Sphingobacteriaceae bacterium]